MHILKLFLPLFFASILFSSCNSYANVAKEEVPFQLLDSTAASLVIGQDEVEGFFDKIRMIDMAIQMNGRLEEGLSREEAVKAYRAFLAADVLDFTEDEQDFVSEQFTKALELTEKVLGEALPFSIQLLKSAGKPYSAGAYYTRENCIVIPQRQIQEGLRDKENFTQTMLHEIFHIYSRNFPEKRVKLYALIGFHPIETYTLPAALEKRILLNPDGLNTNFAIELTDTDGNTFQAVPLIYSKEAVLDPKKNSFFSYLTFQLFQLEKVDKKWTVSTDDSGFGSTVDFKLTDFRAQIGPNTDYIIHPDELMADNFALLALSKEDEEVMENLEPEGRELLKQMQTILVIRG